MATDLVARITEMVSGKKRWNFTLERGRGETYSNSDATLYGHSTYERTSVLAGRPQRVFVDNWEDWNEARKAIEEVRKALGKKFRFEEMGGSTHIPTSQLVSHLPDDTDY
jgi:hypothetical protein